MSKHNDNLAIAIRFFSCVILIVIVFWWIDVEQNKHYKSLTREKDYLPLVQTVPPCDRHGPYTPFGDKDLMCSTCYEVVPKRYGFTEEDILLLSQLLCGEGHIDGDGEYDFGFQKDINRAEVSKVLDVVMNRVRSEAFPGSVRAVVMAEGQFVVMPKNASSEPSQHVLDYVKAWCRLYDMYFDIQTIPEDHLFFGADGMGGNKTNTRAWR